MHNQFKFQNKFSNSRLANKLDTENFSLSKYKQPAYSYKHA